MKVEFNVKYGKNVIEIPIGEKAVPKFDNGGLTNLFSKKVTIYNDIPEDDVNPRRFDRFVIEKCSIQSGFVEKAEGTIQTIVNARTVITKDVERYKSPMEYARLPSDEKEKYYTVQIDDFVVLAEVDDVATDSQEFVELKRKYADNGFLVSSVNPSINGMSVDNVTMTNA